MARTSLRAVKDGEAPPVKERPPTVVAAAESGDRRKLLVAMRSRLASAVQSPSCPPRDLAALSRRLIEIAKEIEAIDVAEKQEAESGEVADEAFDASAI